MSAKSTGTKAAAVLSMATLIQALGAQAATAAPRETARTPLDVRIGEVRPRVDVNVRIGEIRPRIDVNVRIGEIRPRIAVNVRIGEVRPRIAVQVGEVRIRIPNSDEETPGPPT
ncbi:MAG: hypothetical protein QOF21_2290 [Actinomycetota bacterium]|jgi:hypothetical protein